MANLKTYNRTKKLAQSGSMLDAFVAEQMYNKIERIVEEEHEDKKKILIKTGEDLARQLVSLADTLAGKVGSEVKAVQSDLESSIAEQRTDLLQTISDTLLEYTDKTDRATQEVKDKAAMVLAAIELKRGPQGEAGVSGKDGKDGSPDTAEQIAKKLNGTKGSVSMSVIAGLLEEIQALKREVRKKGEKGGGGGGGMGQVQHETKNLTALSTTVVTNFPISGGGYAIMGAYYQSALIMRGEHYTVGGDRKTLTLLFTPENNTKIDIIYVR